MKKQTWILIIILVVIFGALLLWYSSQAGVKVILRKTEYIKNEKLQVQIENYLSSSICFSSCYPYLLQRKIDGKWENYKHGECKEEDINEACLEPKEKKAFELSLKNTTEGTHRLAIPVCKNKKEGEKFKENQRLFSKEFRIY